MSFDPAPFVRHYRKANALELRLIRARSRKAKKEALRLAGRIMAADAGVRRVLLYGSLAEEGPRRIGFDIDIALDGGDLFRALDAVDDSPFEVDIAILDRVPPHVRSRIEARGIVLAKRDGS